MEVGDQLLQRSHAIARCAKAAMLLLSLKRSPGLDHLKHEAVNRTLVFLEKETMKKEIEALRLALAIERMNRRKARRSGVLLLATQVALLLSLWSLISVIAYSFY